jgi:hypothetical protein
MVAEIFAGLSVFKTMFDLAKALKDTDDAVKRNSAVSDLWEQIFTAQTRYTAAIDRVTELEEKLANFETWDTESKRYELKQLIRGGPTFAYALKSDAQPPEPFHCICATCYQCRLKSILQFARWAAVGSKERVLVCPVCDTEVRAIGWPPNFA